MEQGHVKAGARNRRSRIEKGCRDDGAGKQRVRAHLAVDKVNTNLLPGWRMLRPQSLHCVSQRWGWLEAWAPLGSVPTEDSGDGLSPEICVGVSKDLGDTFATGFFPRTWLQGTHPPGTRFERLQGVFLFQVQTKQAGLLLSIQVPVQEV